MINSTKYKFSEKNWKQINMRRVNDLLGVEFIHNLYNRHIPRINSIRFRNVITTWKNKEVNSYAPKKEWDYLKNWLGYKFINLDKNLLKQINILINFDRSFLLSFLKSLKQTNWKKIKNKEIGISLINFQDYLLGELYQVNLVQIEHSLNYAIKEIIKNEIKIKKNIDEILSKIILSNNPTEQQREELAFEKIISIAKKNKIENPKKNKKILTLLYNHYDKYSHMSCAYGDLPNSLNFYFLKYKELYYQKSNKTKKLLIKIKEKYKESKKIIKKLNNKKLANLVPLMIRIGEFRDYNKSELGKSIKYRFKILDEISRRGFENRENLNYYLISEILDLLEKNKKIKIETINRRKNKGITLKRFENLEEKIIKINNKKEKNEKKYLKGICASSGIIEGSCRIIKTKNDAKKIKTGEIMVAIGTDYDLMEAIQKSSGVITEEGGLLSHASVVCRELLKPCCIGVKDATKSIKNGDKIVLNAKNGRIKFKNK